MNVYQKFSNSLLSALLIGLLGACISVTKWGISVEEAWGLAALFKARGAINAPREVVIVDIDKVSEEKLNLPENPEKWPRSIYTRLIDTLNLYSPALIAINVYFGEDRDASGDAGLAKAIAAGRNVILSNYLKQYTLPSANPAHDFTYEKIIDPIPVLAQAALTTAPFPLPKTAATLKQFWRYKKSAGGIPTFPVVVFECFVLREIYPDVRRLVGRISPKLQQRLPPDFKDLDGQFAVAGVSALIRDAFASAPEAIVREGLEAADLSPVSAGLLRSWFALAKGSDSQYFNHYGAVGAITALPLYQVLESPEVNLTLFKDKVIVVGYSENLEPEKFSGFYTEFSNSVGTAVSSTEIAATAIANLIDDNRIRPLKPVTQCLLILFWGLLLFGICRNGSIRLGIAQVFFLTAVYAGSALFLFTDKQIWIPLFVPVLLQAPAVVIAMTAFYVQKNRSDRTKLQKTLGYYLPDHVVSEISNQAELEGVRHYGKLVQGICMASDAGQYTTLSEMMDPLALKSVLNQYYGEMFPVVKNHQGVISDVIGDSMLALWVTPQPIVRQKLNACYAALEIIKAVDRLNRSQVYQLPTRLGLHFGEMHLGNVGTMEHFEYRAVGDTVNTAVRIEGLNKLLGTQILVSASVIEHLSGFFTREVGAFVLKGKTHPVILVELIAPAGQVEAYWPPLAKAFGAALELFQNHQWEQSLAAFRSLHELFPGDGPTLFYLHYLTQRLKRRPTLKCESGPAQIDLGNFTDLLLS